MQSGSKDSLRPTNSSTIDIKHIRLALMCGAPIVFGIWSLALGQDANWDLRNYHWYNPYALLHWRFTTDIAPASIQSYQSSLFDVPWYVIGQFLPARAVGFIIGATHSLNFLLLYAVSLRVLTTPDALNRELLAIGLSAIGILGAGTSALIGTTFNDLMVSIGALASLALALDAIRSDEPSACRAAFIAGLPMGFTIAGKLTALAFALGFIVAFFALAMSSNRRAELSFAYACGVAVMAAIFHGPWSVWLWYEYGNPVFPFFNGIFHSPLTSLANEFDPGRKRPATLRQWLLFPVYFARHPDLLGGLPTVDFRMAAAYVVVPFSLVSRWLLGKATVIPNASRFLFASMAGSYLVWLILFTYYRYAVTLEMLSPLAVVAALRLLPWVRLTRDVAVAIMTFCAVSAHAMGWERVPWGGRFIEPTSGFEAIGPKSLVLLLDVPLAYLVPLLPKEAVVVQLEPQFAALQDRAHPWNVRLRAKIGEPWQNRYGIAVGMPNKQDNVKTRLAEFGLTAEMASCHPLRTTMSKIDNPDAQRLTLCRLVNSTGVTEWP